MKHVSIMHEYDTPTHLCGGCGDAGADGPDWLVRYNYPGPVRLLEGLQEGRHVVFQHQLQTISQTINRLTNTSNNQTVEQSNNRPIKHDWKKRSPCGLPAPPANTIKQPNNRKHDRFNPTPQAHRERCDANSDIHGTNRF